MNSITNLVKDRQENFLPLWKRQKEQRFARLTVMANREQAARAGNQNRLFVAERMEALGMETKDLAEAMEVSNTAAWRYENGRRPAEYLMPALAKALHCSIAQLYRHPDKDTAEELLAGLDPAAVKDVRDLIAFHHWKSKKGA